MAVTVSGWLSGFQLCYIILILLLPDILSRPLTLEDLDQFTTLTKTSPEGVAFTGSAPYEWQEISFLQHHRRSPIHMHLPQEVGRTVYKRIWQYKPPPTNACSDPRLSNK